MGRELERGLSNLPVSSPLRIAHLLHSCFLQRPLRLVTQFALLIARDSCRPQEQNLFGIVQGGLDPELRRLSAEQLVARDLPG